MSERSPRHCVPILAFGASGLAGPLLFGALVIAAQLLPPHPSQTPIYAVIFSVCFFLWPIQPVGLFDENIGRSLGWLVVGTANVLLFLLLGVVVTRTTKRRRHVVFAYLITALLVFMMDFALTGFHWQFISWLALSVALAIYAVPFYVLARSKA